MPRSGRLRSFIKEYRESPRFEQLSFIPPFLILILELILIAHALTLDVADMIVVELTAILLVISIIEILFVSREMHEHYQSNNFDRILTIKIDDFILDRKKEKNVKRIIEEFIKQNPKHKKDRSEIYHICCQVMETHKEEAWEKDLDNKLKNFISRRKQKNVDDILEAFIKKHPKYKKFRQDVYQKICIMMGKSNNKS